MTGLYFNFIGQIPRRSHEYHTCNPFPVSMSPVGGSGNPGEFQRDAFFMQESALKCQGRPRREHAGRFGDDDLFLDAAV